MPEQCDDVLEVLIGQMGRDRDVNAVLRKCAGVLGQVTGGAGAGLKPPRRAG
jgi:hypothetical protein